jgi:hypothetical protein
MGYLLHDERASGGTLEEYDTVSCKHCQAVIRIIRGQRQGAYCMKCGGPVCNTPRCASTCTPFMKKIERQLAVRHRRSQFWDAVQGG